ncbi:hypothetical protein KHA80_06420 [Anaerobacillus sp. HL2]|nr:hypothetical protein KHA80_06420 [Anaerobacillus sp. HL2]
MFDAFSISSICGQVLVVKLIMIFWFTKWSFRFLCRFRKNYSKFSLHPTSSANRGYSQMIGQIFHAPYQLNVVTIFAYLSYGYYYNTSSKAAIEYEVDGKIISEKK